MITYIVNFLSWLIERIVFTVIAIGAYAVLIGLCMLVAIVATYPLIWFLIWLFTFKS